MIYKAFSRGIRLYDFKLPTCEEFEEDEDKSILIANMTCVIRNNSTKRTEIKI